MNPPQRPALEAGRAFKQESSMSIFYIENRNPDDDFMRCNVERLWEMAYRDRKRFRARYLALVPLRPARRAEWSPECLAVEDKRRDALADDVADYVVREFIKEEIVYQLCESLVAEGPWFASIMGPLPWPGLCRVRPLRPVCTENPSNIGAS
jgi:hypothetical protein